MAPVKVHLSSLSPALYKPSTWLVVAAAAVSSGISFTATSAQVNDARGPRTHHRIRSCGDGTAIAGQRGARADTPCCTCLPCRVEFLCHDINVHVPHHVSSNIPWYNLRAATDSLRQNWGQVCPPC